MSLGLCGISSATGAGIKTFVLSLTQEDYAKKELRILKIGTRKIASAVPRKIKDKPA